MRWGIWRLRQHNSQAEAASWSWCGRSASPAPLGSSSCGQLGLPVDMVSNEEIFEMTESFAWHSDDERCGLRYHHVIILKRTVGYRGYRIG